MKRTLGGDRIGSGSKMKVELKNYERSTHDMGYIWRSTMSAGTLVPFLNEVALPADTFDIALGCDVKTHPTVGPLFGSFKVQLDVYMIPIRLYHSALHNNKLNIGRNMAQVLLPNMTLTATQLPTDPPVFETIDADNAQINPSCILSYLGIRGIGNVNASEVFATRTFNGLSLLMYWDIYKNYYANKQEEIGVVIHSVLDQLVNSITSLELKYLTNAPIALTIQPGITPIALTQGSTIRMVYTVGQNPIPTQELINTNIGGGTLKSVADLFINIVDNNAGLVTGDYNWAKWGDATAYNWRYITNTDPLMLQPHLVTFPLTNIDEMREFILATAPNGQFTVNNYGQPPYSLLLDTLSSPVRTAYVQSQEGLAIKTYQSDLFNNWLETEWIDGTGGISDVTAIDTTSGSFTIDQLNISKKVYDMLNRIAVSGGSYNDWLDAVYVNDRITVPETPVYQGGLIKELVFQEVISNAESQGPSGTQPLGTLAGKGRLAEKHKGGQLTIKVDEPSYIMGLVSLTPRLDYSQGNKWDTYAIKTMDDFHKPQLDEIGFQELIVEQMAWFSTYWTGAAWIQQSAGKQPAWINYMTNVNQTRGNFAIKDNEMFMTLNRQYEAGTFGDLFIKDVTTYIDPVKYNQIFAETALDAQNFWVQIAVDMTVRRKMSAKLMPNL